MTKYEQLIERYEDAAFALVMETISVAEGEKYVKLNTQLNKEPIAEIPESVKRRAEKTIGRTFRKVRAISAMKATYNIINKASIFFLAISMAFATAFTASAEFRTSTYNFVMEVFDDHFEYNYENEAGLSNKAMIYSVFTLGWIPENYVFYRGTKDTISYREVYQNENGETISIWLMSLSSFGQVSADAENAIVRHEIINGYDVTFFRSHLLQALIQIPESSQVIHIIISSAEFQDAALIKVIENIMLY